MIILAQKYNTGECINVLALSEQLGISKIYLEQVFSLLKRGNLVVSTKGSQGGYKLNRQPNAITMFDILSSTESSLFENKTDAEGSNNIELAIQKIVLDKLDESIKNSLTQTTLENLMLEASSDSYMYYL